MASGALAGSSLAVLAVGPAPLQAQESDFLFRNPRVTLAIHGGFHKAGAGSEVFDFTIDNLTVNPGDFDSPAFRGELSVRIADNLDLSVDAAWSTSEITSESRDFIGSDDLPIIQRTTFRQTPVSFNLKYYLQERGRSVGNFAWIPRRFSAYVGAGAGIASYEFEQRGEFVIEETLDIVNARLASSSTGTLGQVLAGVEFAFAPRAIVVLDGRYRWATAEMRDDWVEFDDIDLSGFSLSLGLGLRL
jgi:hypothetical protein